MLPRARNCACKLGALHFPGDRHVVSRYDKPRQAASASTSWQLLVFGGVFISPEVSTRSSPTASVAGKPLERMLGHEAVTAGVAGPEIADDVVGNIGGGFRGHH
jgi:hypothetical protein